MSHWSSFFPCKSYPCTAGGGEKKNPCRDSGRVRASSERARGEKASAKDQPKGMSRASDELKMQLNVLYIYES